MMNGLKMAICQMNVISGRPDINTDQMVEEINQAVNRGVEIIFFPELCTTGYFIGDRFENRSFVRDVIDCHKKIRAATIGGITAVFGTMIPDEQRVGENGHVRLYNAAVAYSNGNYAGRAIKTLMPNYRMFDDDRHFFSSRKLAEEQGRPLSDLLRPIEIKTNAGREIKLGVTLCEDIWDNNYPVSPARILADNGADIICNLSASPWTWQKNRKRHEIIKSFSDLLVPFVYVNNVGTQNIGKNIFAFDGCSTVYNRNGLPIFEVMPYESRTVDFVYEEDTPAIPESAQDDSKELFEATRTGIKEFFKSIPPEKRLVVIGLSGGIDSATAAALYSICLGREKILGINMPMSSSNPRLQDAARDLAVSLGIRYEVISINDIVEIKSKLLEVDKGSAAYENLLARTRMDILATRAQQLGGFFTANFNKVEQAFGYGTLGGDMEGCLAVLGDMVKREVYQLADYMNREVYRKDVIPETSFTEMPTADLRVGQKDPFDYGRLDKRGYHDEMVRAFTDFRREPDWFVKMYLTGRLEDELKLEPGTLKRLFPSDLHFIVDLEKHWKLFFNSYFKRVQAPPVLVVSRRSFGADLRESMMSAYLTQNYKVLREEILADVENKILIYGGSLNPPSLHHMQIALELAERFNRVVVIPCGQRKDKTSSGLISLKDKKEMAVRTFSNIPGVELDTFDLDNDTFTPTYLLDARYKEKFPDKEIWHVIGSDLIESGAEGRSEIQLSWQKDREIWQSLNFLVVIRPGSNFRPEDLPPHALPIKIDSLFGSSTMVRERIAAGLEAGSLLLPEVWEYIKEKGLYDHKKNGGQ